RIHRELGRAGRRFLSLNYAVRGLVRPHPFPMNLILVGTSRCDVPARESAGGIIAPLNAARTAQRAVPTRFRGSTCEIFRGNLSPRRGNSQSPRREKSLNCERFPELKKLLPLPGGEGWGEGERSGKPTSANHSKT